MYPQKGSTNIEHDHFSGVPLAPEFWAIVIYDHFPLFLALPLWISVFIQNLNLDLVARKALTALCSFCCGHFLSCLFFLSQIHASNLSSHGPDLRCCVFTVLSSPTNPTDHWGDVGVGFGDAFECGTLRCLRTSGEVELQVATRIFFCQTERGGGFSRCMGNIW